MSTRSDIIAYSKSDDKWRRIYCHFDGYVNGVGRILLNHYKTPKKIRELMMLGDISVLGEKIGSKHPFDPPSILNKKASEEYHKKYGNMCRAYHRDRDEPFHLVEGSTLADVWPEPDSWTEYTYVWDGTMWRVGSKNLNYLSFVPLAKALEKETQK